MNCTTDPAQSGKQTGLAVLPTPRLNLNDLDGIRREMARVYRDMRGQRVPTSDGARLVFVLSELRKLFEVCELEKRLSLLEGETHHGKT